MGEPVVPPPRQPFGGPDDSTVLSLVLDAVREVKEQVVRLEGHLGARLDGLDQRYIPRAEYEARHSDVRQMVTEVKANLAAERTAREGLEDKLTAARRYAFSTSIAGFMAVVGLLSLVLANLT